MAVAKSISELEQLLKEKRERLAALQKRKDSLIAQVASIDKEIATLAGKPAAPKKVRRRRRGRGPKSLQQTIADALIASAKPQTVPEIVEAVKKTGYRSMSKDFPSLVRQVCYQSKLVKTKGGGKFVAASEPKPPRPVKKSKKGTAK